jgi:hypothetical protein
MSAALDLPSAGSEGHRSEGEGAENEALQTGNGSHAGDTATAVPR